MEAKGFLGAVSVGARAAAIGIDLPRSALELDQADRVLVDARIDVKLVANALGNGETKEMFEGANDIELEGVADVRRISVGVDSIKARLSFAKGDVDVDTLTRLAGRDCKVTAERTGVAGGEPENGEFFE